MKNTMKIIIFEDDPSDLSILEECIHTLFIDLYKSYSFKKCKHPNEVLENIGDTDLIFLDIENDQKINGIELGIQIRNMNIVIPIIFYF